MASRGSSRSAPHATTLCPNEPDSSRFFELTPTLMATADSRGRITWVNSAFESMLGWSPDEMIGRRIVDLVHPDDVHRTARKAASEAQLGVEFRNFENRALCKDGTYRLVSWTTAGDGETAYAVGVDVTDRGQAEAEARHLAQIVASAPDAILSETTDGMITSWNPGAERLYGYHSDEVIGKSIDLLVPPERDGEPEALLSRVLAGERIIDLETRRRQRDGSIVDVSLSIFPMFGDGGSVLGVASISKNIGDRKVAERRITESESRYLEILKTTNEGVLRTDANLVTDYVNPQMAQMLGYQPSEMIGRPHWEFVAGSDLDDAAARAVQLQETRRGERYQRRFRRKNGSVCIASLSVIPLFDADGSFRGTLGMVTDITEQAEAAERLREAQGFLSAVVANVDAGLVTVDAAGRISYANPAAQRMLGWAGEDPTGRCLGEFVRPLTFGNVACTDDDLALASLIQLTETVHKELAFGRRDGSAFPVSLTASPLMPDDPSGGTVILFRDVTEQEAERERARQQLETLSWIGRLRDALDDGRLAVYAQPIVDAVSGSLVKQELLVRLVDRNGEVVSPAIFLPVAEEYGLVDQIDRWMVTQAARLAAGGNPVSVNLSAQSLGDTDMARFLQDTLQASGADPNLLTIEITETALLTHPEAGIDLAHRLSTLGCGIALDDFGTGYGSLTYLKRLPITDLKIDREFVRDLQTDEASRHVVEAVVHLASAFGQQTIAEGVEDEATAVLLRELKVDYLQGFHIGRPQPLYNSDPT
ncbi:MAG TPA: PAS domain S-box protein [Chloroflexota bacterium]|nr:PAS domain S-box protein [Chloroflexota bacterium]